MLSSCTSVQLLLTVYDDDIPSVRTTATLTVNVTRNQFAPEFVTPVFNASITNLNKVGDVVAVISATDRDGVSW